MSRLKEDGAISHDDKMDGFSWIEVVESVKSPHVWLLAIVLFFNGTSKHSQLTRAHSPHISGTILLGMA